MKLLEDRILKDGKVGEGNVLKVDSFVNHQIDVQFMCELGQEFKRRFENTEITKILTIEASGIGIACLTAQYFGVPVVFAKKTKTNNIYADVYTAKVESFTHKKTYDIVVSKEFLSANDKVLIIDDFLAKGSALKGLISLIRDAGAEVTGRRNRDRKSLSRRRQADPFYGCARRIAGADRFHEHKRRYTLFKRLINAVSAPVNVNISKQ